MPSIGGAVETLAFAERLKQVTWKQKKNQKKKHGQCVCLI